MWAPSDSPCRAILCRAVTPCGMLGTTAHGHGQGCTIHLRLVLGERPVIIAVQVVDEPGTHSILARQQLWDPGQDALLPGADRRFVWPLRIGLDGCRSVGTLRILHQEGPIIGSIP